MLEYTLVNICHVKNRKFEKRKKFEHVVGAIIQQEYIV